VEEESGVNADDKPHLKDLKLKKCLVYGALLSKSSSAFCHWFCETMVGLLYDEAITGKLLLEYLS
jgi:hypothetical protein